MNTAIILAGGSGTRVGADCPKQFIEVGGKPILYYTLQRFQQHYMIDRIVVVSHRGYVSYVRKLADENGMDKVAKVVCGGASFQDSVMAGMSALEGIAADDDNIAIHYGASPFVTDDIIEDALKICAEKGNAVSGTPCYQLMGNLLDDGTSTEWVDRDKYVQIASPQCLRYDVLKMVYKKAEEKGILESAEPHTTSLMYELGMKINISKGNQTNIKITTREDVELFERYVRGCRYVWRR